jgi:peptidoglycan/LPS O-acetylase OafA/YrhL
MATGLHHSDLAYSARDRHLLIVALVPPLLLQLAFCDTAITRFFGCAQVYFLGQISYAIYLLHWVLLPIQQISHLLVDRLGTVVANLVTMCFIYGLLLAGATLAYRVIEMPCRRWIKNIGVRFDPGGDNAVHKS